MTPLSPSELQRVKAAVMREEEKLEEALLAILRITGGIPGTLEIFQAAQGRAIRRYCGRSSGSLGGGWVG